MSPAFDPTGPIYGDPITVLPSTVATTSATGPAVPSGAYNTLRLVVATTAVSGTTPSMTVTIETSADGSTGWTSVGAFAAVTTVTTVRKVVSGLDRFVRANYAITGTTPSFTFTVS